MVRSPIAAVALAAVLVTASVAPAVAMSTTSTSDDLAVTVDDPTPEPHDSVTMTVDDESLPADTYFVWQSDTFGVNRCIGEGEDSCTVRVGTEPGTVAVEAHTGDGVLETNVTVTPVSLALEETLLTRDGEPVPNGAYRVLTGERVELAAVDELDGNATVANVSTTGPVERVDGDQSVVEFTGPGAVTVNATVASTTRDAAIEESLTYRVHEPGTLDDIGRFSFSSESELSRNDRIALDYLETHLPTDRERLEQRGLTVPSTVDVELVSREAGSLARSPNGIDLSTAKTMHGVRATMVHELTHLTQFEDDVETQGDWNFLIEGHAEYEASSTIPDYALLDKPSKAALLNWTASYDQAHYFVASFVGEYGRQPLLDLLADSEGRDLDERFRAVTGESFDAFYERWMSGGPDDPASTWDTFETKPMFSYENDTLQTLADPRADVTVDWDTNDDGDFERISAGTAVDWEPSAPGQQDVTVRLSTDSRSVTATQTLTVDDTSSSDESGVDQEHYDAVAGTDGTLGRADVLSMVRRYINDQPVDGVALARDDVVSLVRRYIGG